ncbi:PAS domain-containing sensor histidine kinase [Dyadobacter sp. Leaf189]|uniref:PAS domain-containing sensor histidine kinase n=1 Tax=Dyadobacter sp. Leaf189 TaxID=1736295 RepID=UPI0006F67A87|nr:PAS domain-containing sensor histidine kinase [Dyadobacter sp. Leaf189]KQS26565.1 PAS domain-containing sensor histidine kinase [Dyadobacter sp. Leaf189]
MNAPSTYPTSTNKIDKEVFFEKSADLLCIAGFDGYFKEINPAVSNLLEYTKEEMLSRPIDSFIHPEDRNITSQYRENLKNNIPLYNYENRYITKSGEAVWLSWNSIPRYEEQLVYATAKNITHLKLLERDQNLLITSLTKINRDLTQLTYTASHDLRSPVSNLLSVFELMDTSSITDQETIEFLGILKSAAESLKDTLNNYVDALLKKDLLTVKIEELDIEESLNKVRHSLKSLIYDSKTTFHVDFSRAKTVQYNRAYLESTFLNLITNSIKYAIPGKNPEISIVSDKLNRDTKLIYSDRGLGFDMDAVKDKVFGLNQTFHNHADGKGVGLFLIYNHITNLGGSITLESQPNQGAQFTLMFKDRSF